MYQSGSYMVVVLISRRCTASKLFMNKKWVNSKRALKKVFPRITFKVIKYKSFMDKISNHKGVPHSLNMWTFCYPNILLIPTTLWDKACQDTNQSLAVRDGVRVFNIGPHPTIPEIPHYTNTYKFHTQGIVQWFIDSYASYK